MIAACPSCSARYVIDPLKLGVNGRTVRCARCGHQWRQAPLADAPPPLLEATPRPIPEGSNLPTPYQPRKRRPMLAAAWILLLLIVAAVVGGGYFGRAMIVERFPEAAKYYAELGVPIDGLDDFPLYMKPEDLTSRYEDGALVVGGRIRNSAEQAHDIPSLVGRIYDANGDLIVAWTFEVAARSVAPLQTVDFETRLADPPMDAQSVEVAFKIEE